MFGENLRKALEKNSISQLKLSEELGFTQQAINRWCNGITEPDSKTIVKIANYLNVSTDYLLGKDNNSNSNIEKELKEKEILKNALQKAGFMENDDDLTDEELEKLMKFVVANKDFLK